MSERPPCVFIVDDDAPLRESFAYLLRSVGIEARPFHSATDFLREYRLEWPGCLVCDVRMPDLSGLDLYERLLASGATLPVIFMTGYADVPMAIRALRSGALEFVEKPFHAQTMLERVQRALAVDRDARAEHARWQAFGERMASLTDKEREALALILSGAPNKAIAANLQITERAVEMRRASIMRKLAVHSLVELIRLVTQFEGIQERRRPDRAGQNSWHASRADFA
jgi:FixJ family two-component response regulator